MHVEHSAQKRSAKSKRLVVRAVAVCSMTMSAPAIAHAGAADCTALMTAARLQAKTPFHAVYTVTPTTPGAFPTEHHEEIWVDKKMYTLLADKRWLNAPVTENPMGGFTGPIQGFSDCRPLPSMSIRGETAAGYDIKMESGRRAKIWISPKSGLPVHDVVDQDILLVTLEFDYANVRAPAMK